MDEPLSPDQALLDRLNGLVRLYQASELEAVVLQAKELVGEFPTSGFAWLILGTALMGLKQECLFALRKAVRLLPEDASAHRNLGVALQQLGQLEQAEAAYRKSLALESSSAPAWCNLGEVLAALGKSTEAIECYRTSLDLDPAHPKTNLCLFQLYFHLGRFVEAESCARAAVDRRPECAEMWQALSTVHAHLSDFTSVVAESDRAFELRPADPLMWEQRLYSFSYHPDLSDQVIYEEFVRWGDQFPVPETRYDAHDRRTDRPLRIGYVSPDFRRHTSRFFFWPLFTNHDRGAFELFAYSNVKEEVAWTQLFKGQFDHWRDIRQVPDGEAARMIREDGIDILVDLCGHMHDDRLGLFALKPAPIQATWLGSAWTTGLKAIDYALLDPHLAPEGTLAREAIVRLPSTFLAFRPKQVSSDLRPAPCLQRGHITFGYTGRTERLNHRTFRVWGELLNRVPEARLILDFGPFADPMTQAHYKALFAEHGLDAARVVMRKSADIFEGLNDIDILLDSFPHSGGTMLTDALWMGVPAVTLASRPPLGRICTSMLMNLDLPEWIAHSEAEYIEKACAFAAQPERIDELRQGMRDRMRRSPLMDGLAFARGVESAYRRMFERWAVGLSPSALDLSGASTSGEGGGK